MACEEATNGPRRLSTRGSTGTLGPGMAPSGRRLGRQCVKWGSDAIGRGPAMHAATQESSDDMG